MAGLIVQEWLAHSGGSERVFYEFAEIYPDAALRVLWVDKTGPIDPTRLAESWLARSPLRHAKALALPFMLATWRALPAEPRPDWLLVSSHLFAHHARVLGASDVPKLVYVHTPARYIWDPEHDARGASLPVRAAAALLKPIDRRRAQEPASLAANSAFTRERIRRSWGRDAEVIYPPVDVVKSQAVRSWADILDQRDAAVLAGLPDSFVLGASRFVRYKRLELAIRAAAAVDLPVVIAGSGPEERTLRVLASEAAVPVHFVISPSDALLRALYERATALVFAAVEDFGIIPVEAMALGTPVVAAGVGGTAESVVDGYTGAFLDGEDNAALARAVQRAAACDRAAVRAHTRRFDRSVFHSAIKGWVARHVGTEV